MNEEIITADKCYRKKSEQIYIKKLYEIIVEDFIKRRV